MQGRRCDRRTQFIWMERSSALNGYDRWRSNSKNDWSTERRNLTGNERSNHRSLKIRRRLPSDVLAGHSKWDEDIDIHLIFRVHFLIYGSAEPNTRLETPLSRR